MQFHKENASNCIQYKKYLQNVIAKVIRSFIQTKFYSHVQGPLLAKNRNQTYNLQLGFSPSFLNFTHANFRAA